jgi:hypothetical protein
MPAAYTPDQRDEAVRLWQEHGTAEAARRTGISGRTIVRWASEAGLMTHDNVQKTADARVAAAERVALAWADYREQEAVSAGAAAARLRRELLEASQSATVDEDHRTAWTGLLRARAIAYGILIDKAEALSTSVANTAAEWVESDLDREIRSLLDEMEDRARESGR